MNTHWLKKLPNLYIACPPWRVMCNLFGILGIWFLEFTSPAHAQIFGTITNPTKYNSPRGEGLIVFISNLFKLAGVIAGVYLVFQLIVAGYTYLSAGGDAKKNEQAWTIIWQSLLGMVIVASAFVLAGVIGRFVGIDFLNPTIYGPN